MARERALWMIFNIRKGPLAVSKSIQVWHILFFTQDKLSLQSLTLSESEALAHRAICVWKSKAFWCINSTIDGSLELKADCSCMRVGQCVMPRWFLKMSERIEVVGLSVQGVPEGTFWHCGAWEESGGHFLGSLRWWIARQQSRDGQDTVFQASLLGLLAKIKV